jgi:DNA-binding LytR/AlgR family response regulator
LTAPTTVIAEDEALLRGELRDALARLWPELEVVAEAADGIEAARAVEAHAPDVLFLDIEMPGMSGLDVARVASGRCHVVFVTAYDRYAVAAFDQGAVDYVMKPFSTARLATAIARVRERAKGAPPAIDRLIEDLGAIRREHREPIRWITALQGDDVRLITVEDVCYFEASDKYTRVVTPDQESLIRKSIKDLVQDLDPKQFWQIHRSTVVNVNAIAGLRRDLRGRLSVKLKQRDETLGVSESFAHLFRHM